MVPLPFLHATDEQQLAHLIVGDLLEVCVPGGNAEERLGRSEVDAGVHRPPKHLYGIPGHDRGRDHDRREARRR